ncbi:hypothetical protein AB3662_05130 [Sorangium cellulosum]|uniref:hypothetical protein n=1 Tax=Sorangium cellulosum TaxID=56 RepID=UPI003D9A2058
MGMPRTTPFLLLLLVAGAAACAPAAPVGAVKARADARRAPAEAADARSPQVFAFGWKVPCRVPVEQVTDKRGRKARLRYTLSLLPGADGNLDVRFEDMGFLEIDGQDVAPPGAGSQPGPSLGLMATAPVLVVSREGAYVGVRDLGDSAERLLGSPLFLEGPQQVANVAKLLPAPQMKAMLITKAGDHWMTWVGAWAGLELAPGESREAVDEVAFGERQVPMRVRYEHHGPAAGPSGLVRVSFTSTLDDETGWRAMRHVVTDMQRDAGHELSSDEEKALDQISFRRVIRLEAETDPATLRSSRARYEMVMEFGAKGKKGPRERRRDVREDRFDWDRAEGCR